MKKNTNTTTEFDLLASMSFINPFAFAFWHRLALVASLYTVRIGYARLNRIDPAIDDNDGDDDDDDNSNKWLNST